MMEILRTIIQVIFYMLSGFILGMVAGCRMEEKNSERKNKISYEHAKEALDYAVSSNKEWQASFENINKDWFERYSSLHNEYIELKECCTKNCNGCSNAKNKTGLSEEDLEWYKKWR